MLDFENLEQQRKGDESLHCFMSHGFLGLLTARMSRHGKMLQTCKLYGLALD